MANLRYIDKTYIESPDFQEPQEDLTLRINLTDGSEVLFVAEKEFYTPRRIATNLSDVLQMENIVEYSPNNVAIIKLQNGQTNLTKPQYYVNSIVKDVYKQYELDTFFTELDDELAVPEYVGTDFEKRQLALNTLLNLEDLAVGAAVNDPELIAQATEDIDNNFSELAGLDAIRELTPAQITTPQEDDQLTSLDFVGLTNKGSSVPGGYASSPSVGASIPGISFPGGTGAGTTGGIGTIGPGGISTIGGLPGTGETGGVPTVGGNVPNTITSVAPGDTKIILPDGSVIIAPGNPLDNLTEEQKQELGLSDTELPEESLVPDDNGLFSSDDTSGDIIDPVPSVDETALIRMDGGLPIVAGQVPGLETVNQAIQLINTGIQQVEGSLQGSSQAGINGQDNSNYIIIADGKQGYSGGGGFAGGRSPERKVARTDVQNKLLLVKTDIAQQENINVPLLKTSSGVPTLIKTQKSSLFSRLVSNLNRAGVLNAVGKTVGAPVQMSSTTAAVPSGYQPMSKQQILDMLYKTKSELENILAQG